MTKSAKNKRSNSAKAKGYIDIFMQEDDWLIEGIYINFEYLEIDEYTTPSWFIKQNANFKTRNHLFKLIGLKQEQRPNINANKTIVLDEKQIKIVNDFFNNYYFLQNKTIKNIISILKGNNAGGSFANPKNAEMIIDLEKYTMKTKAYDSYIYNLFMVLDLILKNQKNNKNSKEIEEMAKFSNNYKNYDSFMDKFFDEKNDSFNKASEKFGELLKLANKNNKNSKEKFEWTLYQKRIIKEIDGTKRIRENIIDPKIESFRNKASSFEINVFDLEDIKAKRKRKMEIENAHIYDVKYIKKDLENYAFILHNNIKNIDNDIIADSPKFQEILGYVASKENLLNLPIDIHKCFDRNEFTYSKSGDIQILDKNFELEDWEKCLEKIPQSKLSQNMIQFIIWRNQKRK
ncbi:MAG4270 family putative restriction endonuclease [Mycoplasma enhydrae]|uniref:MAG4270 family putative restriction endonuclease n=1 Tax=Mycoplasma enhydrae TaxID=2499220 RepID=UPI00384D718A